MQQTYLVTILVDEEPGAPLQSDDVKRHFAEEVLRSRLQIGDTRPVAENAYTKIRAWGVNIQEPLTAIDSLDGTAVG